MNTNTEIRAQGYHFQSGNKISKATFLFSTFDNDFQQKYIATEMDNEEQFVRRLGRSRRLW